jgi:hypothetical protein
VFLDGADMGYGTPVIQDINTGPHTVTLKTFGYQDQSKPVTVTAGGTARADFTLIPKQTAPSRAVFRGASKGNNWLFDTDMIGTTIEKQDKFGQLGDIPVVGDFNKDGIMDRAVFRGVSKGNNWLFDYSMDSTNNVIDKQDKFGQLGDIPLVGDFNNDGVMDRAVFRSASKTNNWIFDYNMDGTIDYQDTFGQLGDIPVVGDFNNDGIMDRAVFRGASKTNNWILDYNMDGKIDKQDTFGKLGDIPLVGDFNNDGKMDRAVFRSVTSGNNWFIDYNMDSTNGKEDKQDKFGQIVDLPIVWNI